MNITICNLSAHECRCCVEFSSEFGTAWAFWDGEPPVVGSAYDVEIDVPQLKPLECKMHYPSDSKYSIRNIGDRSVLLQGQIIHSEDGDALGIQIGDDVVLLESAIATPRSGAYVTIEVPAITLYPINL